MVSSLTGLNSLALQNAKVCLLESNPVNDIECSLVYSDKSELSCNNGTNLRCDWLKSLPIESTISKTSVPYYKAITALKEDSCAIVYLIKYNPRAVDAL